MVFETLISFDDETKTRGKAVIIGEEDVVFAKVSFYYGKKNPNLKYDIVYINQDWLNRDMPDYATKYTFAATQLNQTLEVFYDILFGKIFITI